MHDLNGLHYSIEEDKLLKPYSMRYKDVNKIILHNMYMPCYTSLHYMKYQKSSCMQFALI